MPASFARFFAVLLLEASAAALSLAQADGKAEWNSVKIEGKAVCMPEFVAARHGGTIDTAHPHQWGFLAGDGKLYALVQTRLSEAIFKDATLRQRTTIIHGRLIPNSEVVEPLRFQTVQEGRAHDLLYYCLICAITSVTPEDCACCQEPVELIERPAE